MGHEDTIGITDNGGNLQKRRESEEKTPKVNNQQQLWCWQTDGPKQAYEAVFEVPGQVMIMK